MIGPTILAAGWPEQPEIPIQTEDSHYLTVVSKVSMNALSGATCQPHRRVATVTLLLATFAPPITANAEEINRSKVGVAHRIAVEENAPETVAAPAPDETLSLERLEELALTHNPSIARFQAAVAAARGNWLQVGLPPNPMIGYEGQQLGSGGRAEQHGIAVGQEFIRGGKLQLSRQVAAQDVARAQQQLATQQQRVITDVRIAFYEILLAKQQLDVAHEIERISEAGAKAAETLLKAKEVGRIDLLQAQLERENARILTQNARNRYTAAWQGLTAVLGLPEMPPQPVTGDVEVARASFEWQSSLDRLLSSSPEISAAVVNIERARWSVERARAEPRPNVTVDAVYNVVDNGIDGDDDANVTVSIPVPLWNRNQGAISQAQAEVAGAHRALEQLELRLQSQLAPVFERYANARNQVARYRETILPAANETLELSRRSYEAGETGFVNLLTVQRTFSQTNLAYLQALRELRLAEVELEGLLLRNSLEAEQ